MPKYTLVENLRDHIRVFDTEDEVMDFLARQQIYNKRKADPSEKHPLLFGDNEVKKSAGKYVVTFSRFNKIETFDSLKIADEFTIVNFDTSDELKNEYKEKICNKYNPLVLVYQNKNQLKSTPVLYNPDLEYMSHRECARKLYSLCIKDRQVIRAISAWPGFTDNLSLVRYMESFRISWENYFMYGIENLESSIYSLVENSVFKKDKTNKKTLQYKKMRDLAIFTKNQEENVGIKDSLQHLSLSKKDESNL